MLVVILSVTAIAVLLYGVGVLKLVKIKEGAVVLFKYLDGYECMLMQSANHFFEEDGRVVKYDPEEYDGPGVFRRVLRWLFGKYVQEHANPGEGFWRKALRWIVGPAYEQMPELPRTFGSCWCIWRISGWAFYLKPFVEPVNYSDNNDDNVFGEGIYVWINDLTPDIIITMVETKEDDGSSVPLTRVKFTPTVSVAYPYRLMFQSPKKANISVLGRLAAGLRAWVKSGDEEHAQAARGDGKALWKGLKRLGCGSIFKQAEEWGLEFKKDGILIDDIDYDPAFQAAMKAGKEQQLLARGETARVFDPIRMAMDAWVEARRQTQATPPETLEQARARLSGTPEYAEAEKAATALRSKALAGTGYRLIETSGELAPAIAVAEAFGLGRRGR